MLLCNLFCYSQPNFSGNRLTSNDLGNVLEEVLDVSAQWYQLGLQLKVKTGTLDSIQVQFLDPKRQLLEMLKTWLNTSNDTSWKTLMDALGSNSIGASQLAGVLERKHCLAKGTEVKSDGLPVTAATSPSPPPVSEQDVPTSQLGIADMQGTKCK